MRTQARPPARDCLAIVAGALALTLPASAEAAFPGANGRIAFTVQRWRAPPPPEPLPPGVPVPPKYGYAEPTVVSSTIETVLPSGRGRQVLYTFPVGDPTYSGEPGGGPAWSPSGKLLAFAQGGRLAIMRHDGTALRQLPQLKEGVGEPAWSPDGRRLAFIGTRSCPYCGDSLYTVRSDGAGLQRVTNRSAGSPAWSAKGVLAFLNSSDRGLYSVRPDGSRLRRLFGRYWGWGNQPDWAPDGGRVAFSARGRIFSITAGGRGLRRLSENLPGHDSPAWSPDGRYIAFSRGEFTFTEGDGLYLMRSDGRGARRIAEARFTRSSDGQLLEWEVIGLPTWQPLPRR
jgi:dipeptidyl aminopeptidase/acylaminoacyl peptidase